MRISDWSSDVCSSDLAERCAELRDHRIPAALVLGRVQGEQRGEAVPRSAERDALAHAEQREEQRGADPDRLVAGQEGDRRGRSAEQEERDGELGAEAIRTEEHTSELQSLMRTSYAVFCMKKKNQ